jgi:hypothetical protein
MIMIADLILALLLFLSGGEVVPESGNPNVVITEGNGGGGCPGGICEED